MIINIAEFTEIEHSHTAAYIHTDDIRDNFVTQVAGEPNDATILRMEIRMEEYHSPVQYKKIL